MFRRPAKAGLIATLVWLVVLTTTALAPRLLSQHDPLTTNVSEALQAPSLVHLFGTDQVGRDLFARVAHASQQSVMVALLATIVALAIGALIGLALATLPTRATFSMDRSVEVLMALPEFLIALFIIAILGPGQLSLLLAVAIAAVPGYAAATRSLAVAVRHRQSVEVAKVLALSRWVRVTRYMLPELLQPLMALAAVGFSVTLLSAASLSFLGLGVQPPTPDLGVMLSEARQFFSRGWWVLLFPGLWLTATAATFIVLARALRARLR